MQSEIGRGGFGQVLRAFDPTVGRMVAVKTLTAGGEPELLARFRNEAAAAGKLRHKNIVTIYDFGEHNGTPYLVMELLDGQDIEHIIDGNVPLTLLQKLDIMLQVAAGLDHAHKNGVVHRDVKPANVMVLPDGSVKILDFGIALVTQTSAARITPKGSLLGTFPYMAPEQFYGSASDALSDIFAYGVTSYKFLTGKHPFHALEMAKLMHNIMNMSPEPLRNCIPGCPEILENAMIKLLAKDRDARYQSLEDLQFDLEPAILDLRRENVRGILVQAGDLMEAGQLEDAQAKVRQALEIDAGNRTARELRENLQRLIREKTLRPRIEALVSEGRVRLDERSFEQAIEKLESALRLDKSNPKIHLLLEEARAAWMKAQRAEQLLEEAALAMNRGDLTIARETLSEALGADPNNERAAALLARLQAQIEARERERRLRDELSRIRGLILLQSFDEAAEALERLAAQYPDCADAAALLERVHQEREVLARRHRLEASTAEAKELLRKRQYAEAVEHLARCRAEFPDSAELRDLAAFAAEQLNERKQAQAVAQIGAEARALADKGEFDAALEKLRIALDHYPGAAALRELMQTVAAAKAARQRQTAHDDAVRQASALCNSERFAEALECIGAFVRAYGDTAPLAALRKQAEEGFERQGRSAAIRRLVVEAQGLINDGRPATATEVLLRATREFPGEPEVTKLLDLAQDRLRGQQREEAISTLIREAEGLARAGEFDRALALLDGGLRDHPGSERLQRCRNATLASRAAHQREIAARESEKRRKEIASVMEQAKAQLALGRAQDALQLLQPLAAQYPSEEQLLQLLSTIAARIREQKAALDRERALAEARAAVEGFYRTGRFEDALREIQNAEQRWGRDPALTNLKTRIESEWQARQREAELADLRRRHLERLQGIESLIGPGTPKRELRALRAEVETISASHPADSELLAIANRVRQRIAAALAALQKPIPWIPIGIGAAIVVVGLAILLLAPRLLEKKARPVQLVSVEIRTNPPGAAVHVGDRFCLTPNCRFDLPPGHYEVSAQLKDYQPRQQTLIADAAQPNLLVDLNLQPVPQPMPVPVPPVVESDNKTPAPAQAAKIVESAPKLPAADTVKKTAGNTTPPVATPAPKTTAETKRPPEPVIPPKVLEAPTNIVSTPTAATPILLPPPSTASLPPPAVTTKPQPVPDPKLQAEATMRNGIELSAAHRWKEAITVFGEAIRLDPASSAAYYDRAESYYSIGQFKDAIADYGQALALQPNYPNANEHLKLARSRAKAKALIVGGEILAPIPLATNVNPSYPRAAREAGIHGVVTVECVIEVGGDPQECRAIPPFNPVLGKIAVEAVSQWRFQPALRNGQKVPVMVTLTVSFNPTR
ncbi:MAG: TonB family protein [Bryobacteraceae bacterium]